MGQKVIGLYVEYLADFAQQFEAGLGGAALVVAIAVFLEADDPREVGCMEIAGLFPRASEILTERHPDLLSVLG